MTANTKLHGVGFASADIRIESQIIRKATPDNWGRLQFRQFRRFEVKDFELGEALRIGADINYFLLPKLRGHPDSLLPAGPHL
jgi:hypothetical protein